MENLVRTLCNGDIERLESCLKAYRENANTEDIEMVGYNEQSGYVYIVLGNGVTIAEAFNGVEYITYDNENDEEEFSETYLQALKNIGN